MAKAAWCTVTPTSGKENGVINISAAAHTGRIARSTSVVVQAVNGTRPTAEIAVSQAAAAVSTTMDTTKPDVPAAGGSMVINGTSNSSKLKWAYTTISFGSVVTNIINLPGVSISTQVNGAAITNDAAITGDPGGAGRYNFTVTITMPKTPFPKDMPLTFKITDDAGVEKTCTSVWKAGSSSLSATPKTVSLASGGTAQTINITSNDEWTVS